MIAAGVIGGLAAAVFGLIDWLAIPAGTRAKAVGLSHGLSDVLMVILFATSWLLRVGAPGEPGAIAIIASLGGFPASFRLRFDQDAEGGIEDTLLAYERS